MVVKLDRNYVLVSNYSPRQIDRTRTPTRQFLSFIILKPAYASVGYTCYGDCVMEMNLFEVTTPRR